MSDFISELRRDLLDAHAAQQRRTQRRRAVRRLRLRLWRPATVLGAATAVACAIAVAVAVPPLLSPDPPARLRVVAVVPLGGLPLDGAFADGSLWVSDWRTSAILRVDLDVRAVVARIPMRKDPVMLAPTSAGGLWVETAEQVGRRTDLVHVDRGSGRVTARFAMPGGIGSQVAVGARLWVGGQNVKRGAATLPLGILELDTATGRPRRRIPFTKAVGLAVAGDVAWAIDANGTLAQIDVPAGRVVRRWPRLALLDHFSPAESVLAADAAGVWVLSTETSEILRVEEAGIARRIAIEATARPLLARTPRGLWYAEGDELAGRYRVHRLDPGSGKRTGTVAVGAHQPIALVPAGDQLAVVARDGTVVLLDG